MSQQIDNGITRTWGSYSSGTSTKILVQNAQALDFSTLAPNQDVYAAWSAEFQNFYQNLPSDNAQSFQSLERIKNGDISSIVNQWNQRLTSNGVKVIWMRIVYGPTIQIVLNNIYARQLTNVKYEAVFRKNNISSNINNFTFQPIQQYDINQSNFKTLTATNTNPYTLIMPFIEPITLLIIVGTIFAAVMLAVTLYALFPMGLLAYLINRGEQIGDILIGTGSTLADAVQDVNRAFGGIFQSFSDFLTAHPWVGPALIIGGIIFAGGIIILATGSDFGLKTKNNEVKVSGSRKNISGNIGGGVRQVLEGGGDVIESTGKAANIVPNTIQSLR